MKQQIGSNNLTALEELANYADGDEVWPEKSWRILQSTNALGWVIPHEFGGQGVTRNDVLSGYEQLASACLTTCFILSQRDAAIRRLRDSARADLCAEFLPDLASGKTFTTVGLAQLTTSRQHIQPPVTAVNDGKDFLINGTIPWVTGASFADFVVTGAVLKNDSQILVVFPMQTAGVTVGDPLELMALQGSVTAEIRCKNVRLNKRFLLAGPAERVMTGTGGLETSCLALGLAGAAIGYLHSEAKTRPFLQPDADRLDAFRQKLRDELQRLAKSKPSAEQSSSMRARANTLVLQATQTALAASKGTGFLRNHPAQRWARQALFFLVWSCPGPVVAQTMGYFAAASEQICE